MSNLCYSHANNLRLPIESYQLTKGECIAPGCGTKGLMVATLPDELPLSCIKSEIERLKDPSERPV
jgi:hypothetical protein